MTAEKKYDLVPASAFLAWAVYADYDGNAPDTENVVLLASYELAKQVLEEIASNHDNLCYVDGSEWAKQWRVRMALAPALAIATSFSDAKARLGKVEAQLRGEDND
jgi:hypothetical protein